MDRDRERERDRDRDSSRRDRSRSRDRDRSRLPTTTSGIDILHGYLIAILHGWPRCISNYLGWYPYIHHHIMVYCMDRSLQGGGSSHSVCSIREVGTIMMMMMMMRHVVHFEQMVQLAFGCLLMHVSAHSMGTWLLSETSFGHTYPPIYPCIYSPIYLCIYSPALGIWATSTSWRLRLPLVSFMQITSCAMYLIHSSTSSINHIHHIHSSIHWMPHYTCIWLNLYFSPIHLMLFISFIHPPHPSIHFIHPSHPFHLSIHWMSHNTSI